MVSKDYEKFQSTFVLLYLDTILYSDKQNYMDFLDSNLHLLLLFTCVLLCHYVCYMCVL